MAAIWFDATVDDVLGRVQNTETNPDVLRGTDYIERLMGQAQDDIIGMMPKKISQPLQVGEVWGHILVDSANDSQLAADASQTIPQTTSNWHIFIDYDRCGTPPNNKGFEAVEGTDYDIVAGIPDFTIKPLTLGSRVLANYYTNWDDNFGMGALQSMLEEWVALLLLSNAGIADNPDLLENVNTRKAALLVSQNRLRAGEMVPMGLQQLNLLTEVETNDDSKTARIVSFSRGR